MASAARRPKAKAKPKKAKAKAKPKKVRASAPKRRPPGAKQPTPAPASKPATGAAGANAGAGSQAYAEQLARVAMRNQAISQKGREIGPIPDIADPDRREACLKDLKLFCKTYNPAPFYFSWSPEHVRGIARIEDSVTNGGLYAFSWRRGGGKTTTCRMAGLWGAANALIRYGALIGANFPRARANLAAIKMMVRFLPLFAADFPEISYPVRKLGGIAQRANGQLCLGQPTLMEWSDEQIVLPAVPPPANWPKHWPLREDGMVPTSGTVLAAAGLTSDGIRGLLVTTDTGDFLRPDFVLLDDPQTRESAQSPTQNVDREQLVSADVLGLAGPGKKFGAVMPCTPIVPGDMVDCMLDRSKHPAWRGERSQTLKAMPKNMADWQAYFEVYADCIQQEPKDYSRANAHYIEHRARLDEGTAAAWEDCKQPFEVSAIQSAMHIYFERGRRAFMAEYQGQPEAQEAIAELRQIEEADLVAKLNRGRRGQVPPGCERLTAFIDVQGEVLFWLVCGWTAKFGGAIVDYGAFPRQRAAVFTMDKVSPKLEDAFPGQDQRTRIYSGLVRLTDDLLSRSFPQEGSPSGLTLSLVMIDTGFNADAVHDFISRSKQRALLKPSKGKGIGAGYKPLNEYRKDQGDQVGWNWRIDAKTQAKGRFVNYDTNAWKTQVAEALLAPPGAPTSIYLPGEAIADHPLLSIHLRSERRKATYEGTDASGRRVEVWTRTPNMENHFWDCLVGAAVAASVTGLKWDTPAAAGDTPKQRAAKAKRDLNELLRSTKPITV